MDTPLKRHDNDETHGGSLSLPVDLIALIQAVDPHRYDIPFSELVRKAPISEDALPISETIQEDIATFRIQGVDADQEKAIIKARAIRDAFLPRLHSMSREFRIRLGCPRVFINEREALLTEYYAPYGLVMCLIRLRVLPAPGGLR